MTSPTFSGHLQAFFTERLLHQRHASPHTIASYRDTFCLLLRFASQTLKKHPSELELGDLGPSFVGRFLHHLETERGNGVRTRNARLAAIRSFFRYVAMYDPDHALICQQILAMPNKRQERHPVAYLERQEVEALLAAPDTSTWIGRRDRLLLLVAVQTGLRVSELIGLRRKSVELRPGAYIRCEGKGRKNRSTPLRTDTIALLRDWMKEGPGTPQDPVFPSLRCGPLSRDAVERLVTKYATSAAATCPSLLNKRVTPHVLRHTAAMDLLQHGVDRTVIALWLGHESPETTQVYLHADMTIKERALGRTEPLGVKLRRFRPDDQLLAFLESL